VLDTAIAALECGALQYLGKPVAAEVLCASVARACTLHRLAVAKRQAQELQGMLHGAPGDLISLRLSFDNALETLWLAFQPVVRSDGRVAGYEALAPIARAHAARSRAFIGAAERLGRLDELGARDPRICSASFCRAPADAILFLICMPRPGDDALYGSSEPLDALARRVVFEITERASSTA